MSAEDFAAVLAGLLGLGIFPLSFGLIARGHSTTLSNRLLRGTFTYLVVMALGSAGAVLTWRSLGPDLGGSLGLLILAVAGLIALVLGVRAVFGGAVSRQCPFCEGHGYVLVEGFLSRKKRRCEQCRGTGRC
jgi:hypothetical protein